LASPSVSPAFCEQSSQTTGSLLRNGRGDQLGAILEIVWQSYGVAQATGTGKAVYVAGDQSVAQGQLESARIVASDLGTCQGRLA